MFTFEQERKHHERYGNVKRIFRCDNCDKKFPYHVKLTIHEGRVHNPSSKHYKPTANKQTAHDNSTPQPTNFNVGDPALAIPLVLDMSSESVTTSLGEPSTGVDTSTSEYRPTNESFADAHVEEIENERL